MDSMNRMRGKIKKYVADRGFGFITADDGKDYFFHYTKVNFPNEHMKPEEELIPDRVVEFTPVEMEKGPQAHDVIVI